MRVATQQKVTTRSKKKAAGISGPTDVITQFDPLWNLLLKRFQKISRMYGFQRVETPVVEDAVLYHQCWGEVSAPTGLTSEVAGQHYVVRSSLLPSVLRSYAGRTPTEQPPLLSKWSYAGNVVNRNGDQLFSDYEFGFEVFGEVTHLVEAQALAALWYLLESLGLQNVSLEINTTGTPESQNAYQTVLVDFLRGKKYELCDSCHEHLRGRALNIFRCSNLDCALALTDAPAILDFLDESTQKHFTAVLEALDELQIPYQLNPLYAGPEGTTKTNVVVKYRSGDSMDVIGEAGYHDSLLQNLGAKASGSAFGFVGSLGVISELMKKSGITVETHVPVEVYLVPLGDLASRRSLKLFRDLTSSGVLVHDLFGNGGVKNQLKQAELNHSPIALIMGQKEAMDETVILRDVKSGMQEIFAYDKIVDEVKKRLGH